MSRSTDPLFVKHQIRLSDKGRAFVEAWKRGDKEAAVRGLTSGQHPE